VVNTYPIFTYTRAEAIADGVLIDVTDIAREMTFVVDVALTNDLYRAYIGDLTRKKVKKVKEG